jgi:hypothetical protein
MRRQKGNWGNNIKKKKNGFLCTITFERIVAMTRRVSLQYIGQVDFIIPGQDIWPSLIFLFLCTIHETVCMDITYGCYPLRLSDS